MVVLLSKISHITEAETDNLSVTDSCILLQELALDLLICLESIRDQFHLLVWYCLRSASISLFFFLMCSAFQITHVQVHTHAASSPNMLTSNQSGSLDLLSAPQISCFYYHTPLNFHEQDGLRWARSQQPSCLICGLIYWFSSSLWCQHAYTRGEMTFTVWKRH